MLPSCNSDSQFEGKKNNICCILLGMVPATTERVNVLAGPGVLAIGQGDGDGVVGGFGHGRATLLPGKVMVMGDDSVAILSYSFDSGKILVF